MEPFISPDGNYLFFNDSNSLPQTNLYYATRIDDVTFQFQGEIGGANATGLNAVASMDVNDTFYFVSTRSYSATLSTIYWGIFSDGSLSNVAIVPGISKAQVGRRKFRPVHKSRRQHAVLRRRRLQRRQSAGSREHRDRQASTAITLCVSETARRSCARSTRTGLTTRRTSRSPGWNFSSPGSKGRRRCPTGNLSRRRAPARQSRLAHRVDRSDHGIRGSARAVAG